MGFEHPTQRVTHFIVSFIDIKYDKIVQYILPILNNLPNGVIHYNMPFIDNKIDKTIQKINGIINGHWWTLMFKKTRSRN